VNHHPTPHRRMGTNDTPPTAGGADRAFAFISKGWREVRDSAAADLRLMRARADRGLEQLLASAPALAPPVAAGAPIAELELVRRRIQELRRQYSSRAALGGCWPPGPAGGASLRVGLSGITAIRNAVVAEGDGSGRWRVAWWKGGREEEGAKEWEVVRMMQSGFKDFERRSLSSDVLVGFRGRNDFVERFKLNLVI
jgi:digalactosyldiacylglycerol synthase